MTDLKDFAPVQINTLYGFDNVKDFYWLVGYDVVNTRTGHVKKLSFYKRNYPYVTLETSDESPNKKCLLHHLLALAYINNDKFEVIEHLDDNPLNYDISNLKFSTQSENLKRAFNIPRQTLYCRYYAQTSGRKIQSVKLAQNFNNRSTD